MKDFFRYFLWMVWAWSSSVAIGWAGTIVVPSSFVLHRPLNPALHTRINETGLAYGVGLGNRNLFNSTLSNCELKDYTTCKPDRSDFRLLYTNWDRLLYLQVEAQRIQKTERDLRSSYSLNFNQSEYDTFGSLALQLDWLSIGGYRRDTDLKLREFFSDITGHFTSKYQERSINYGYGVSLRFWDWLYLAYYRDGPTDSLLSSQSGRVFEQISKEGLRGAGFGFRWPWGGPQERPDEMTFEVFKLLTKSPVSGQPAELVGIDFEVSLYSLIYYAVILQDVKNNYFNGEILRDTEVSFATGVGYNGDTFQILFGREARYFSGMDAGAQVIVGVQF